MADKSAAEVTFTEATQQISGQIQAASNKVFTHGSDDPPVPIFVNGVEFSLMGMDVFMDVGQVSPESIRAAMADKGPGGAPVVDFYVNYRFGMSLQSAVLMHQRLTQMIQQVGIKAQAAQAETTAMKSE